MRRFQFRLDPALRLRKFRLEEAQLVLAAAQRTLAEEEERARQLRTELETHRSWRAKAQSERLDAQVLADGARFEVDLLDRISAQDRVVHTTAMVVDEKTEIVHQRHAETEALERLKDRRKAEHFQEALAQEQKALDEHSVTRWKRS